MPAEASEKRWKRFSLRTDGRFVFQFLVWRCLSVVLAWEKSNAGMLCSVRLSFSKICRLKWAFAEWKEIFVETLGLCEGERSYGAGRRLAFWKIDALITGRFSAFDEFV